MGGKVDTEWPWLSVESAGEGISEIRLGEEVHVSARVNLTFSADEVTVRVLTGLVDADGNLKDPFAAPMQFAGREPSCCLFQAIVQPSARSGLHGYAICLLPNHPDSLSPFLPGLIKWARRAPGVPELQVR